MARTIYKDDLTNQEFGLWTVISKIGSGKYLCRCGCGYEKIFKSYDIIHETRSTCRNCYHKNRRLPPICGKFYSRQWDRIIKGAKSRNIEVNTTPEQVWQLYLNQDRKCALSGTEIYMPEFGKRMDTGEFTASLDRIDSSGEYVIKNLQWLHKNINLCKREHNQDKFLQNCKLVATYRKNKHSSNEIYQIPYFKKHHYWIGCGELSGFKWGQICAKAEKRNISVQITIEDAWQQFVDQDGRCNLTDQKLTLSKTAKENRSNFDNASLDRINSNYGYLLNNIQWVHQDINQMKWDFGNEEFIKMCTLIYNNMLSKGYYDGKM